MLTVVYPVPPDPDSNDTSLKTIKHDYIKEVQAELATLKKNIERSRGTKHSKPAAKRTDFSDESSSMSDLSDESNEEEDIGGFSAFFLIDCPYVLPEIKAQITSLSCSFRLATRWMSKWTSCPNGGSIPFISYFKCYF